VDLRPELSRRLKAPSSTKHGFIVVELASSQGEGGGSPPLAGLGVSPRLFLSQRWGGEGVERGGSPLNGSDDPPRTAHALYIRRDLHHAQVGTKSANKGRMCPRHASKIGTGISIEHPLNVATRRHASFSPAEALAFAVQRRGT
jgi:hypothetical protein